MSTIKVTIVTPKGLIFSGEVEQITIPTNSGEIGIFPDHIPLIATSSPGIVQYVDLDHQQHFLVVDSGMVQIDSNQVQLLVQRAKSAQEINDIELDDEIKNLQKALSEEGLIESIYEVRQKQLTYFEKMKALKHTSKTS